MCIVCETAGQFNSERAAGFGQKMVDRLNSASLVLMISLGHRTRLFDCMAKLPASTSRQIADAAGLNERYVREWLGAMVTGGVVDYDPQGKTYHLPAEHAQWLTRAAVPNNLAATSQWMSLLGGVEEHVLAAFHHGKGVRYEHYKNFHEVMAEESQQTVVAGLFEHILPLDPTLDGRLNAGIDLLDIGCGAGLALLQLAERYPQSRFTGIDFSDEAIAIARRHASERGLNNVQFKVGDVAKLDDAGRFDVITAFDAIHDQAQPAAVLANVARALKRDGLFLMQEISGSGRLEQDISHPFGPMLYTVSCMHCMSVSLGYGGPGLGAMWGRELAEKMLGEAGFRQVRVEALPHDPLNFFFLARK